MFVDTVLLHISLKYWKLFQSLLSNCPFYQEESQNIFCQTMFGISLALGICGDRKEP
jgi:hypothetical protein